MKAGDSYFSEIMGGKRVFAVPFFQRRYVWDDTNWEDLLKELEESKKTHFLGSIIYKHTTSGDIGTERYDIIDGQQRLTTLSVLFRVCCDICKSEKDENTVQYYDDSFKELMTNVTRHGRALKLEHSLVDRDAFRRTMGDETIGKCMSDQICKCYDFFFNKLKGDYARAERVYNQVIGKSCALVAIMLTQDENEQEIFDVINSAGVRLTSSDIVKNAIFQRLVELSSSDEMRLSEINNLYLTKWTATFEKDEEALSYWTTEQSQGRFNRSRLEIFLQCVAVIKGIFDPEKHSLSELSNCYKQHFSTLSSSEAEALINEISIYAEIYREAFSKDSGEYEYADNCQRLIHILHANGLSTFDPLVLKLLKDDPPDADGVLSNSLIASFCELESYVMRHIICSASTKNFNKECAAILGGKKTVRAYYDEKVSAHVISDAQVRQGLRCLPNNGAAKLIIFWLELYARASDPKLTIKHLPYDPTLEHIMPRTWAPHWADVKVLDPTTGSEIADDKLSIDVRTQSIREIGNMTLLPRSLNASIKNNTIEKKIEGEGRRNGVRAYNDYFYTKEVIESVTKSGGYVWNEKMIRDRTNIIADRVLSIW